MTMKAEQRLQYSIIQVEYSRCFLLCKQRFFGVELAVFLEYHWKVKLKLRMPLMVLLEVSARMISAETQNQTR